MNKVIKNIYSVSVCTFASMGAIKDLTQSQSLCFVVIAVAFIAMIVAIVLLRLGKNRDMILSIVLGAVILLGTASWALEQYHTREERTTSWDSVLSNATKTLHGNTTDKACQNDGPSLYALALDCIQKNDFAKSREYASRASINGNSKAFMLLALLYLEGYGGPRNIHLAIANQINANRINSIDNEPFLQRLRDFEFSIPEKDNKALNQCLKYVNELETIIDELNNANTRSGETGMKAVLTKYDSRLNELSAMGYIPATQLLYAKERLIDPKDTNSIRPYVELMYQANAVPTNQRDRFYFMSYLDDYYDYRSSKIDLYIENNVYPSLLADIPLYNDLTNHDVFLIQNYRICRAQYEYSKSLMNGEREPFELILKNSEHYDVFLERSRTLLLQAIDSVRMVLPVIKN